jgi:hypothetical protein
MLLLLRTRRGEKSMKLCGYDWPQGGTKQVVFVDDQGRVIELVRGLESPSQSADLTELTGAPPPAGTVLAGYAWSAGRTKQVVYVDGQRHVIELFVAVGNPWQWVDLTELTGAPPPAGTALIGYDWLNGNTKQVVYVDSQKHVIELVVAAGSPWQWVDLTELTGAPPPVGITLAGYDWSWRGTKQVVYVDSQKHVIELFVAAGSPWQWVDLTELTGAPPPVSTALIGYAWSAGGTKQVVYVDSQKHVIELVVAAGSPWQWVDLTELTGAPLADQGSLAGYDWLNGNTKQVVYVDSQKHVIELVVAAGSPWQWVDLTSLTGAPLPHQNLLTGFYWVWSATKQVVYVDDQGQVIELWVGLSGQWHYANLTARARREAARHT